MGGLRSYLPTTYWTYLIAALAISGAPLTAGFFSKDLILWQAFAGTKGSMWLWFLAWLTAGVTAFYMFRQFFLVFHGPCRVKEPVRAHIHESPRVMTVPLVLLAFGSVFAGWVAAPEFMWGSRWDHWLEPVFGGAVEPAHGELFQELFLMGLTLAVAAVGFVLAYLGYGRAGRALERFGPVPELGLLANKYYVDEIYDFVFVRPLTRCAGWLAESFDPKFIDAIVNGVADRVRGSSLFWRQLQSGNVQHYLFGFLAGTLLILAYYLSQ